MSSATAAVLVTGSEILLGRTQDRNSSFLARALDGLGLRVVRILAVDDDEGSIEDGLRALLALDVDLVVTSGGLGPTHDDRTVAVVARVAGVPLALDEATLAQIDAITTRNARTRGLDPAVFATGNRKQATVPVGARVLTPVGTAPGVVVACGAQTIVVLPGPPVELQRMWEDARTSDRVAALRATAATTQTVLRVYGLPESQVADVFAAAGGDRDGTETTICASRMEIEVLVRARAGAEAAAAELVADLRTRLGEHVYAEGEARLEAIVIDLLRARGLRLAVAESCTAGLLAARIVNVPGASDVFRGGVVAYDDAVKRDVLGVPAELLARVGAVSADVAAAMAEGARRTIGADVGIAVTGIAGPGGGSDEKPVGLVHLHAVAPGGERALERRFSGPREIIREWSVTAALHLVREHLTSV